MRNRYLDLLRAAAIVRVVVYHVTGVAALTIVFPAMSVMFALAGSLMAASMDRFGASAVRRRMRRLLPSLWAVCAIFIPAMLLTDLEWDWRLLLWVAPLVDPPANSWGGAALSANWYLRDFLWFVLISPLVLPLFRRFPVPVILAPYLLLVLSELKVIVVTNVVLRDIALYFGAWILGFAHHDGMLRRLTWKRLVPLAAVLAVAGAAWTLQHPGPRGFDLNDIRIGNALWSAAFVLLALGLAPDRMPWLDRRPRLSRAVTVLNCRALTIYLWHVPIVVAVGAVATAVGWPMIGPAHTTVRLALVVSLIAVAVALFGWVEDVAARRAPTLLPGRPRVAVGRIGSQTASRQRVNVPRQPQRTGVVPDPPRLALPVLVALNASTNTASAGTSARLLDRQNLPAQRERLSVPDRAAAADRGAAPDAVLIRHYVGNPR